MLLALCTVPDSLSAQRHVGSESFCLGPHKHTVLYNTTLAEDGQTLYDIDSFKGLKALKCDNDGSRLEIIFHDEIHSTALWVKFKTGNAFLTGAASHGCPLKVDPSDAAKGFLLRRVNSAQLNGQEVIVRTSLAQYDEIYKDASIKYGSEHFHRDCDREADGEDKPVCVGVNTDVSTCKKAAKLLPIYSNGIVSLTCSNCFAGFYMDVFFDLEIEAFSLKRLQGGFRNISVNSALEVAMQATKSWSIGVDKEMPLAGGEHNPIISFKIGPVPFVFWFEASQRIKADIQLQSTAQAQAGVTMYYNIGDAYVSWDAENHWQSHKPTPSLEVQHALSGSAEFNGQAALSIAPSVALHVNQLYSYSVILAPSVSMLIRGDTESKQICEFAGYDVSLSTNAQLHLNIPVLDVHKDKQWGPTIIWAQNGTLSKACAKTTGL